MREPRTHAAGEEFSDREKPLGKIQSVEDMPLGIEFTWKPDGHAPLPTYLQPGGQSDSDDWATPATFFERYDRIYRFTLDVCATAQNARCARFFTKQDNGLAQTWAPERCWMNPPYSGVREWMRKAYEESRAGALVVCLLPSRTGTAWFHDYAVRGQIEFLRGRLKFGGCDLNAPFESMVVTFYPGADQLELFAYQAVVR